MRESMERVMELQRVRTSESTPAMQERGELVRNQMSSWVMERADRVTQHLPATAGPLLCQGKDGAGRKSIVPWVRIAGEDLSPKATEGWYLCYLFDAAGDSVYLALMQGATIYRNGSFVPQPEDVLQRRSKWARSVLGGIVTPFVGGPIDLRSTADLPRTYESGTVASVQYLADRVPSEHVLEQDLEVGASMLASLYRAQTVGQAPGEKPLEIELVESALSLAATGRTRPVRSGIRASARDQRNLSDRARTIAKDRLESDGWTVRDAPKGAAADLRAQRGGERVDVTVRGTTSDGGEILLSAEELDHTRSSYPETMLVLVTGLRVEDSETALHETTVVVPWRPDENSLTPIAYRYSMSANS